MHKVGVVRDNSVDTLHYVSKLCVTVLSVPVGGTHLAGYKSVIMQVMKGFFLVHQQGLSAR